jgi:hypothetical protein
LYRSLNGAGKEHKAGSILLVVDPDKQDSEQISHMHAAKSRIDEALAPLSEQQADFLFRHKDTIELLQLPPAKSVMLPDIQDKPLKPQEAILRR